MDLLLYCFTHVSRGVEGSDEPSIIYVERKEPSGTSTVFRINTQSNR